MFTVWSWEWLEVSVSQLHLLHSNNSAHLCCWRIEMACAYVWQVAEGPHVQLFSLTRSVVRKRKITSWIDIQSVKGCYWICFSWTWSLSEEFLLNFYGCWFLNLSFNQKFLVLTEINTENNHHLVTEDFQFGPQVPSVTVFTPKLGDLQGLWSWNELQF